MEKEHLIRLLNKHLSGTATVAEKQELAQFVETNEDPELFTSVIAESMQQYPPSQDFDISAWRETLATIVSVDKVDRNPAKPSSDKVFRLYRWAGVAAVLFLVCWGAYHFLNDQKKTAPVTNGRNEVLAIDLTSIRTEKNTLRLDDGKQIILDEVPNGRIAESGEVNIYKQDKLIRYEWNKGGAANVYNIISIARGQQYEVELPDGSRVWLNAGSSIRLPVFFLTGERVVELSGEALFDVKHSRDQLFMVKTGALTTTVLGTSFNIKAYPDQAGRIVSVQRGKVKVEAGGAFLSELEKGEQIRVIADTSARKGSVDPATVGAWKNGELIFTNELLKDVITDVRHTYNDSIVIKNASLANIRTTVSFNKGSGIDEVLEIICRTVDGRLKKENGVYIIE